MGVELLKSCGYFFLGILKRIYWLIPSILSDPFDIAERWFGVIYTAPPNTFWVLLFIGFFIAAFLTYNDIKRKLDSMTVNFFFEPTGNDLTTTAGLVMLNVTFKANPSVIVDKLFLEIDGSRIASSKGITPFKVSPQYTDNWTFDLADKIRGKTYIGKLIAVVDKKEYESREFDVHA